MEGSCGSGCNIFGQGCWYQQCEILWWPLWTICITTYSKLAPSQVLDKAITKLGKIELTLKCYDTVVLQEAGIGPEYTVIYTELTQVCHLGNTLKQCSVRQCTNLNKKMSEILWTLQTCSFQNCQQHGHHGTSAWNQDSIDKLVKMNYMGLTQYWPPQQQPFSAAEIVG